MSVYAGPEILSANLVLMVDAINPRSYSGSGNSWINLANSSSIGNTSSFTIYSAANGAFSFNATNSWVNFGTATLGLPAANKTMCAWIYPTNYKSGLVGIVDQENSANGYGFWLSSGGKLWYWPRGNRDVTDDGPLNAPNNAWTYVTTTYNNSSGQVNFYYNSQLSSSKTVVELDIPTLDGATFLQIGSIRNGGTIGSFAQAWFGGSIAHVSLYNKILTQSEIQQNFNAHRGRFGV